MISPVLEVLKIGNTFNHKRRGKPRWTHFSCLAKVVGRFQKVSVRGIIK